MSRNTINKSNDKKYRYNEILKGFRPPFYYESFKEFYSKCGFNIDDVSLITGRSKKTIKRWEKSGTELPVYLLIYSCAGFTLSEAFYGFRLKDNLLYTGTRITYNFGFTAGQIINYSFEKDHFFAIEEKNKKLEKLLLINQEDKKVHTRS